MINPLDIEKKEFKSSMRGYDKTEVNEFMTEIARTLEENIVNLEELTKKYNELKEEVAKYKQLEETMSDTLLVAKQTANELLESAKKKEEIMLKEAEMKVDEKFRKAEMQTLEIERNIEKLKVKYESEKIRLTNFLKAQLALIEDEVPTIEHIKEHSNKLLARKRRTEVILEKSNHNSLKPEKASPKEALIHKEEVKVEVNNENDEVHDDLPNLENIKQDLQGLTKI